MTLLTLHFQTQTGHPISRRITFLIEPKLFNQTKTLSLFKFADALGSIRSQ